MSNGGSEPETGTLGETYHAALQHGLVSFSGETQTLVGVVRRPTGWFLDTVDENVRELGPSTELLDRLTERRDDLKARGMCDEGAHNAAWEELGFEAQYQKQLETEEASAAVDDLASRIRAGEDIVLVCFEGENKRCHRHELESVIEARV